MENELVLEHINKKFDDGSLILQDIDLRLKQGTKLSVLGPSGSGKTTLLRLIAGLENPDSGHILFNGQPMNDCPPHKRNFGLMFQEFALFPNLNMFNNIAFGLKMKGMDKAQIESRVNEMLLLTGLTGLQTRHVDDLSGGERQRVALARTLAPQPSLLMLDEPLSSLDRVLRKRLLIELTNIISKLNITTIFVTHDHEEAFAAGNMVIVMNTGQIEQTGTPDELVQTPKNQWIKEFLGL
ncbi:MAG: ABC transporter ATP-binding protein [Desulfobacula sp.]|uniref:ABC transporter ATP-binding protein n=1 Tax=Desulfobacula sp. TaxID=2593537 RepID=UPI0025B87C4E|nr:ABC transporter ATP-binding protein [Desulfobacula sp.]MCD4722362.1 ABC transporter ATP-binding protein [Desulfobacula sp.]